MGILVRSGYEIYASYEKLKNIYEGTFIRNILRINNAIKMKAKHKKYCINDW